VHFLKRLGSFFCRGSDGRIHSVEAYQEYRRARSVRVDEPVGQVLVCNGKTVTWIDKGRYQTAEGIFLSADESDAP
jgi:hypothetical protein